VFAHATPGQAGTLAYEDIKHDGLVDPRVTVASVPPHWYLLAPDSAPRDLTPTMQNVSPLPVLTDGPRFVVVADGQAWRLAAAGRPAPARHRYAMGSVCRPVAPDGAFYVYFDVSRTGLGAMEFCERLLAEAHVALTPGVDFGNCDANKYIRLSYAASISDIEEGLSRLGKTVQPTTARGQSRKCAEMICRSMCSIEYRARLR
jgi:hypothetical protein